MNLKRNYYLFLPFLCSMNIAILYGQGTGTFKGVVRDASTKEVIAGANIYDPGDITHGVASDGKGHYELQVKTGRRAIVCSFISMQSDTLSVDVEESQVIVHNFLLKSTAIELQTMVITAGKFEQELNEVTVSMEVLKPSLIENKNSTNIKSVLEQTPGLNILDNEPQLRGGSGFNFGIGSRVAILIDGLPAMAGDGGRPEWNFIPQENIEQIEVIKGASSVIYGSSALSGSVNFRTAFPKEKPTFKASTYTGMYDAPPIDSSKWWKGAAMLYGTNFLFSERFEHADIVFGAADQYDHGYIGPPSWHPWMPASFNDTTTRESEVGEKTRRMNCNLRYRPSKIPHLDFGFNSNFMRSQNNWSLIWDNDSSGLYRAFPNTLTLQNQLIYFIEPYLNYYTDKGFRYYMRTRYYETKNVMPDQTIETDVTYSEFQVIKQFNSLGGLNMTSGIVRNRTHSVSGLSFKGILPNNQLENYGFYTQLDKKFWQRLNLSAGFREETFKMNDEDIVAQPVFRSGINYQVAGSTFLRYSFGQGYRFPTITEKYMHSDVGGILIYPNPKLKPESSWSTEIGFKQGFKINDFRGYIDGAVFWQEYKNTIEFTYGIWDKLKDIYGDDSLQTGFKYLNIGKTRVRGVEASLAGQGKIAKDFFIEILGGYTYALPQSAEPDFVFETDSTPQDMTYKFTSTDTTDNVLKYRFEHLAKVDLQLEWKMFSLGGSWRYYSFIRNIDMIFYMFEPLMRSGIIDYRKEHDKGIHVFDARVGIDVTKKFKLSFVVNNVMNLSYSLRPLKIESPRTFSLRLSFNFGEN